MRVSGTVHSEVDEAHTSIRPPVNTSHCYVFQKDKIERQLCRDLVSSDDENSNAILYLLYWTTSKSDDYRSALPGNAFQTIFSRNNKRFS